MRRPRRGEVWVADIGIAGKPRPVIVIGRNDPDPPRALTTYVPITTKDRDSRYEVDLSELRFLDNPTQSVANAHGVTTIPTVRFVRQIGSVPSDLLNRIEQALLFAVGMGS